MKCEGCGGNDALKCIFKDHREVGIKDKPMNMCRKCIKLVNDPRRCIQPYKHNVPPSRSEGNTN